MILTDFCSGDKNSLIKGIEILKEIRNTNISSKYAVFIGYHIKPKTYYKDLVDIQVTSFFTKKIRTCLIDKFITLNSRWAICAL